MVVIRRRKKPSGEMETIFGISSDAVPIIKEVVKWGAIILGAGVLLAFGLAPEEVVSYVNWAAKRALKPHSLVRFPASSIKLRIVAKDAYCQRHCLRIPN